MRTAPSPENRRPVKNTQKNGQRKRTANSEMPGKGKSGKTMNQAGKAKNKAGKRKDKSAQNQALRDQKLKGQTRKTQARKGRGASSAARTSGKRPRKKGGFLSWPMPLKIASIVGGVLVLAITAVIGVAAWKMSQIKTVDLDTDALNISEQATETQTGYLNVALFGLDGRETDPEMGARSDTIIIASLNRETGEVKMSSIYRDTLLQQKDGTYNKANAAYSFGGAEDAIAMLNKNLDMDIEKYVTVDFAALVDVIDAVGGVEIDVTEEEIPYLNNYAVEVIKNTGVDSAPVTQPGKQLLNGVQATGYARIRYTKGDDFKRAERQRAVIEQIVKKMQASNLRTINKIIDKVFSKVETNFTMTEILAYAKNAMSYKLAESQGFPSDNTTPTLTGIGSSVVPNTLESNVIALHKYFFGDDGYTPSSTVKTISSEIESKAASLDSGSYGSSDYDDSYYDNYYDNSYDNSYNNSYDNSYEDDSDYDSSYDNSYDSSYDDEDY